MPIVTNPTAGDVHVNRPLTNFSQRFMQKDEAFIGLRAIPNLPVSMQSDLYYEFDRGDFWRDDAQERADGTESSGSGFTLSTSPYFAKVYAHHKDVTDRQRANQDSVIRLDQSATQFVTGKLMIRRERLFQQTYVAANIWFNGSASASAGQDVTWGNASSDPIADVRTAIRGVHQITGYRPNRMIIGRTGWDTLLDNDEILSRITGGATVSQPAKVLRQLIAQLFEIDEIYVMDSVFNSAIEGAADSFSFIGDNDAVIYYAPPSVSVDEPTAAVQFSWTGLLGNTDNGMRVKRFRWEAVEADRVEGQMAFDYKVTSGALGHFFVDVDDT